MCAMSVPPNRVPPDDPRPLSERERRLWLGTYYYDSIQFSINSMHRNVIWKSDQFKQQYLNFLLEFQFVRISELEFRVTCMRTDIDGFPPSEYILRFQCTISYFEDTPKLFDLQSSTFLVFQKFFLEPDYRQRISPDDLNRPLELKIAVYMFEYDITNNRLYQQQEREFEILKQFYLTSEIVASDMCYILRVRRLENIYTGRQTMDFSNKKNGFIIRTSIFSRDIRTYMESKEVGIPLPPIDLPQILNYIFKGERTAINQPDLISLYLEGHALGLSFLMDLCKDVMFTEMGKPDNGDFLVEALVAVDRVNDHILFDQVLEELENYEAFLISERKLDFLKSETIAHRFLKYTFEKLLKYRIVSRVSTDTGGASTSRS